MLKYFSNKWDIYLGTFIDAEEDWQHVPTVQAFCAQTCIRPLRPRRRRLASLRGLLTGEPLSTTYYADGGLRRWVDEVLTTARPDAVLLFSGCMAQFMPHDLEPQVRTVFDPEDVDSEKWRSYAEAASWPLRWLYAREARRLLDYERRMAARHGVTVFVSAAEADVFRQLAPEVADRIIHRTQGVDASFFDPDCEVANPYTDEARALVFTGAMDYWPNVQAVTWFADAVWPAVREAVPDAHFYIVGIRPTTDVQELARRPGVVVTGAVDDIRPYLKHARAACVPLRIARGIQNKVLEAMAMEKPIVATSAAMVGIEDMPGFTPTVTDDADALAAGAIDILEAPPRSDAAARACILEHYDWQANLRRLEHWLLPHDGS